jgi:hypothetical protein
MRKIIFIFLFSFITSQIGFSQNVKIKSVLFVGNSYTAVNDLPNWVRLVGASQGDTFDVTSFAPGGRTFQGHSQDPQLLMLIQQRNYDAVILQEQSQIPSFPTDQVETECYPFAKSLVDSIRANNPFAKIIFYMTWGRKDGDAQNCPSWPPVCTFKGMNQLLRDRYIQMAKDNYTWVAPVGAAWRDIRDTTNINLYQTDGSHPSFEGTHLPALTIYQTLFQKKINDNCFVGSLTQTNHKQIKNTTTSIFNDSISNWNHDTCKVPMQFEYNMVKNLSGDICFLTLNAVRKDPRADYHWFVKGTGNKYSKIGSGFSIDSFKTSKNSHFYLKVKNACGTDSSQQNFVFVSVKAIKKATGLKCIQTTVGKEIVLPNKTKSETIQLIDIHGRIVDTKMNEANHLYNIPKVKSGMYYLFLNNNLVFKLLVE